MRTSRWRSVVILLTGVTAGASVHGISVFAQSDSVPSWDGRALERIDAARATTGILRSYAPATAPADARHAVLPGNLAVADLYRPAIDRMLRHSGTFRRQCARLGSAPALRVVIETARRGLPSTARARTRLTRVAAGWDATVELPGPADVIELVAHEFEHIIEQLDGVDLKAQAGRDTSGVRHGADGAFETIRAIRAGRTVAEEVRRGGS